MSTIRTTVTAQQPGLEFEGSWGAKIDDIVAYEYYKSVIFDLTSLLYAKVGAEFSKYGLDTDLDRLNKALSEVEEALKPVHVVG
ncbi:MAG: hypothetical protein DRI46_10190 [Chloroflexi bacterium]|nr:MAG: hypothetical protein DRI46_10190 [Chloroflexota bacterium]